MAEECLRLAIAADNRHALAYNNLGVIEIRNGNVTAARTYFHAAANTASYVYEAHFNSAHLAYEVTYFLSILIMQVSIDIIDLFHIRVQVGDLQTSYNAIQKSLISYPGHYDSKTLLRKLQRYFSYIWGKQQEEYFLLYTAFYLIYNIFKRNSIYIIYMYKNCYKFLHCLKLKNNN